MKVLKFGGSSVGSAKALLSLQQIVEARTEPTLVVVSALGGITDQLIRTANLACSGDDAYLLECRAMENRHLELMSEVTPEPFQAEVGQEVLRLFEEMGNIFRGVYLIKDLSARTLDTIVSYGERLSSLLVSRLIKGAQLFDSRTFIKTHTQHGKAICDFEATNSAILKAFEKLPSVAVIPGFISTDLKTGDITNLGRGGSDYTASILAAALNADLLEIWTDVDGFLTADPRVIPNSYVIDRLTYLEAMELCNFGAKVIYPPTIYPVYHKNIPIVVKNTFNPEAKGSYISRDAEPTTKPIKGISSINDTCLITIQGLGMVGIIGINHRIFRALAHSGISVFLVAQASSENTTSIGVRNADATLATQALEHEFAQEIAMGEIDPVRAEHELATVAIVGENMKGSSGVAGKLFDTLGRNGINVIACAQGASETNISFVIKLESLHKALNVIHDSFFLSEYQILNLFLVGVGVVGRHLLDQIEKQQEQLRTHNALRIRVVGIANSRRAIFDRNGVELSNYNKLLEQSSFESTPETLRDQMVAMNLFNSVFVDCTASSAVAGLYHSLLENNISVVTANKIAASAEYEAYARLKQTARAKGVKFLFETNVGAGLPIISTMNSLITSGDRILKIEAVLSGTLNFILNTISADVPLSQTIRMAQEAGYAEPDPRIDLSGLDVIRKLVILSREAGYPIEQSEVERQLFIPERFFNGSIEQFWESIPQIDAEFEEKRAAAAARGSRFRFVAKLDQGRASVSLQEVDRESPLYSLEGSNNIILFTTERYNEFPMIIKGYGAGASVTAAGVFADIISIANIR